ncbi:glycoside hydrolase [Teratosphaeria nubilosa]|uniref:Glycoside hydrolase n=1 Tax=Teratosphaeria nubilosa TaxID=161662 RepID=A0A6G1KUK2_9PEZI|nr:glycoside hydrolase [Teratosphaeria nubilosa]
MVLKRIPQKGISFGYCDTKTGQRVYPPLPVSRMTDLLPEQLPPPQKPAHNPDGQADDMFVKVTCSPPLGQATQIARNQNSVLFTVLLETSSLSTSDQEAASSPGEGPQVCLWHNHNGQFDWAELPLKPTHEFDDVLLLNRPTDRSPTRTWFTAELPGFPKHAQAVNFTIKFRVATCKGWRWIKDTIGVEDGELNYQSHDYQKHSSHSLHHFFEGISPDIKIQPERPDTDDTSLYSLTAPVNAAKDPDSGYQHHELGKAKDASRWFSVVRLWSPWLAPRQGKGKLELDKDAILVSFLRTDGLHVVCLGISGVEDVLSIFTNDGDGNVIIKSRNDRTETGTARVLVAVADTFDVANAAVMYAARKVVGTYGTLTSDDETAKLVDDKVKPQWLEEWYDGLTYCTWNGLGQNLTDEKIYRALDSLSSNNINITNLIIDDNWQSLSTGASQLQRAWTDFEADRSAFPEGLKATTAEIRTRHPNINHIAVWHAILGYWGGVAPDGWIAKNYKTTTVEKEDGVAGGAFTIVAAEDAKRLYDDFYRFLSANGVDSVKTDAQFFLDLLLRAPDRRALKTEYQDAWTLAHLRHFSSRAISCMSQAPQLMFHSQLPTNKPRLLVRNSDDFFPEVEASHPWHIFCNAHNSVFTQHLNVLPDWDMFQTSHPWASFHAAARAISGGPIYFTDEPGKHDIQLIGQMTAQTTRGKTVILRPHRMGRAMDVYNAYDSHALLKVGTYVGFAQTGTSILGIFNCNNRSISEFLPLSSFPGTEQGQYIIHSFTSSSVSAPMTRGARTASLGLELAPGKWDILSAHPLHNFTLHSKPLSVAPLGLLEKMTGIAALTGFDAYVESNGRLRLWVQLKALGVLGVYVSDLAERDLEAKMMVLIFGKPIPKDAVRVSEKSDKVLEIDVAKAWQESGEKAGWSNEVSLEVFIS